MKAHTTTAAILTLVLVGIGLFACWQIARVQPNGIYEAAVQLGKMAIAAGIAVIPAAAYIRGALGRGNEK